MLLSHTEALGGTGIIFAFPESQIIVLCAGVGYEICGIRLRCREQSGYVHAIELMDDLADSFTFVLVP